jgi:hypothetical protein
MRGSLTAKTTDYGVILGTKMSWVLEAEVVTVNFGCFPLSCKSLEVKLELENAGSGGVPLVANSLSARMLDYDWSVLKTRMV